MKYNLYGQPIRPRPFTESLRSCNYAALFYFSLSVFLLCFLVGSRLFSDGSGDLKTGALVARSEAYNFIKKHDTKLAQKYYLFLYQKDFGKKAKK